MTTVCSNLALANILGCEVYESGQLPYVTHIMDIDGFPVGRQFYPKEVALLCVDDDKAYRIDVRLPCKLADLTSEQQMNVKHVSKNIHGIPWSNKIDQHGIKRNRFLLPHDELTTAVEHLLAEYRQRNENKPLLVAYKGGNVESTLLNEIGVPSVNLESYSCPKFDYLVKHFPYEYICFNEYPSSYAYLFNDHRTGISCDTHTVRHNKNKIWHCPIEECRVFNVWRLNAIRMAENHRQNKVYQ